MKILIAEAHNLLRATVADHLRHFYPKAEISRAYNFFEAFDNAKLSSYDLIFLDAGIAGFDFAEGLKILFVKNNALPGNAVDKSAKALEMFKLTKREKDVLIYLIKGISNKEIASSLGLQIVTIKMHLRSICKKLEVKNRTQAALKASCFI